MITKQFVLLYIDKICLKKFVLSMALLAEFREFCIVFFVNDGGVG